jgi:hypothetical protein
MDDTRIDHEKSNDYSVYYTLTQTIQVVDNRTNNYWYHVRIDFECGAGVYQGLAADTFHVYINKIHYGDYGFRAVTDSINRVYVGSSGGETALFYVDAVDISSAAGYYFYRNYIKVPGVYSMSQTRPSVGNIQTLGVATHADRMFFNPNNTII